MASAIPITDGIAGEHHDRSGEFFTFEVGTAFKVAEPASGGSRGRVRSRPRGRIHRRPAGGDGHHR